MQYWQGPGGLLFGGFRGSCMSAGSVGDSYQAGPLPELRAKGRAPAMGEESFKTKGEGSFK